MRPEATPPTAVVASSAQQAATDFASPVPLSAFQETVSVAEQIALTDARVRQHVSYAIAGAFVVANVLTLAGVAYLFHEDNANIVAHVMTAQDRVITPRVVMAIVGATTYNLVRLP